MKKKSKGLAPENLLKDPAFSEKLDRLIEEHRAEAETGPEDLEFESNDFPRYVFSNPGQICRDQGVFVEVSNGFEVVGGSIVRKLAEDCYLVSLFDEQYPVWEMHRAWIPIKPEKDKS